MRLVFLGTPDFALPSLNALAEHGYEIAAVITQPDRPSGRGHKLQPSCVKARALELGFTVYAWEKIRDPENIAILEALAPDLMVTAAYGQILNKKILAIPKRGTVNVHGSLLPLYRGAAPIQRALMDGQKETGITTMLTHRGVDNGPILLQRAMPIVPEDNAATLSDKLALMGAELLIETLENLDHITPQAQDEEKATHCAMLTKEDGRIDWTKPAPTIVHQVQGVTPWPGATCMKGDEPLKIIAAFPTDGCGRPGEVLAAKERLVIAAGEGAVELKILQAPGKKPMAAADFLRGHEVNVGEIWGENQ